MKQRCLFLCLLLLPFWVSAQNIVFSAEASPSTVGVDDVVKVVYMLENIPNLRGASAPDFGSFQVVSGPFQSQSTNYSFNGGQQVQTSSVSLTYVLKPSQTGTFTIAPIIAKDASGKTYQCNPLTIRVVPGSTAPKQQARQQQNADPFGGFDPFDDPFFGGGGSDPFAAIQQQHARMQQLLQQLQQQAQGMNPGGMPNLPNVTEKDLGKNVFVKAIVDKTKVRLGEQVTVTYKMYTLIPMQAQLSKLPSLNGFWTQDFELPADQKPQQEILNGQPYQTFTLKKSALFPQQTGKLTLDPAEIKGVARVGDRYNPYGREVQFTLKSTPVPIEVVPLPTEKQPADFGGAVGKFSLSAKLDKTQLSTDDVATLTLNIAGTGNLKLIEAPVLKLPNGLDAYEPQATDTITSRSLTISGNKIFTYSIAPRVPGDYEIPPISFSFYDPATNTYTTLNTPSYKLQVSQGKNYKKDQGVAQMPGDIHPILTATPEWKSGSKSIIYSPAYWSVYALSIAGLLVVLYRKKQQDSLRSNTALFKKKNANKIALKRMKAAKEFMDQGKTPAFYEEVSKAIWLYLSDKLHIPLSGLSKETAADALASRNISSSVSEKLGRIIDDCELSLYAPSIAGQQMNQTYTDAVDLIGSLEEMFKK
ncbi:BatD family protein [Rurimicrobium arvi]|uniref:BatD family protein n=1 Tax=Rurimicrobium arvi TaxID=2049916 RepID=A0ABP8MD34_9BACT